MEAVRRLNREGVRAGVNCAPVLPQITDSPVDLDNLVRAAAAACATFVMVNPLFLKPCSEKIFLPFLAQHFPKLVDFYKRRYSQRAFLPAQYANRITALVRNYCEKHGVVRGRDNAYRFGRKVASEQNEQLLLFREACRLR
jgi:DNA repair photolyase